MIGPLPTIRPLTRGADGVHRTRDAGQGNSSAVDRTGGRQPVVWSRGFGVENAVAPERPATAKRCIAWGRCRSCSPISASCSWSSAAQLDLDAPVQRYLPSFTPTNPFGVAITLRQLMSHYAGLVREPPVGHYFDDTRPTLAATVASLNQTALVYAPGTTRKYSNAAIASGRLSAGAASGRAVRGASAARACWRRCGCVQARSTRRRRSWRACRRRDVDVSRPHLRRADRSRSAWRRPAACTAQCRIWGDSSACCSMAGWARNGRVLRSAHAAGRCGVRSLRRPERRAAPDSAFGIGQSMGSGRRAWRRDLWIRHAALGVARRQAWRRRQCGQRRRERRSRRESRMKRCA